jgi:Trk K+ transport system NAD-binding subunit
VRKGEILHAHRDTKLEAGDRIIVFAPTAAEQEVKKALFG